MLETYFIFLKNTTMVDLNKLFTAAALAGALSTQGCADDCELTSKNGDSTELATADAVIAYCNQNKAASLACLEVLETDDKVDCTAYVFKCSSPGLGQDITNLFSTRGGEYCVEDPAQMEF